MKNQIELNQIDFRNVALLCKYINQNGDDDKKIQQNKSHRTKKN